MLGIADLLSKRGADLVSITEKIDTTSAAGKMVTKMLMVLSEFERDQVSERTRCALQHMKQNRQRVGAIPFGYRVCSDGKTLEADLEEQETITMDASSPTAGALPSSDSVRACRFGRYARNGKVFEATQVRAMLPRS